MQNLPLSVWKGVGLFFLEGRRRSRTTDALDEKFGWQRMMKNGASFLFPQSLHRVLPFSTWQMGRGQGVSCSQSRWVVVMNT